MSIASRFIITKERRGITVRFKTPKSWFLLIFGTFWLAFWTLGGVGTITALIKGTGDGPLLLGLCFWLFGEIYVSLAILWTLFGQEIITIREGTFEHVRHIFGFGRRRTIPLRKMSRPRAQGPFPKLNAFGTTFRRGGLFNRTVVVRLGHGRHYKFGTNLDKNSAKYLVTQLRPYFDEIKKPTQLKW